MNKWGELIIADYMYVTKIDLSSNKWGNVLPPGDVPFPPSDSPTE